MISANGKILEGSENLDDVGNVEHDDGKIQTECRNKE